MNKILTIGVIIVLIIAGVWFFTNAGPNNSQNTSQNLEKVKIGFHPILASLPLFVAQENGYFTEAGIEPVLVPMQTGELMIDAFVRGDIDITPESTLVPVLRVEQTNPGHIKIYATGDITKENPFATLIVPSDSDILSLNNLENKRVGVFPGGTSKNLLRRFLQSEGLNTETIEFIELPPTTQLQALSSGSIDALLAFEPGRTIALESGNFRTLYSGVWASILDHNPLGSGFISTEFIEKNPELAKKTVEAFDRANQFIKTNDEDTRAIIAEHVELDRNIADKVVPLYFSDSSDMNKNAVAELISILVEVGELNQIVDTQDMFYEPNLR